MADVPHSGRGGHLKGDKPQRWEREALERAIEKHLDKKTRPWAPKEYIFLDGVPHVYTPNRDIGTIVHLRGGGTLLLRDAYVRNMGLSGPLIYRLDDLYDSAAKRPLGRGPGQK